VKKVKGKGYLDVLMNWYHKEVLVIYWAPEIERAETPILFVVLRFTVIIYIYTFFHSLPSICYYYYVQQYKTFQHQFPLTGFNVWKSRQGVSQLGAPEGPSRDGAEGLAIVIIPVLRSAEQSFRSFISLIYTLLLLLLLLLLRVQWERGGKSVEKTTRWCNKKKY